jgi:hypothetical protein
MNHDERQELVERIAEKPRWYKAKTLGRLMRLTEEERARWGIDSIWAFTWTDADVRERDRATRRQRKQTTRRRQGAVPREEYEATSKSRTEPWKALNMSRPTYYRKLKAGEIPNETSVSPLYRDSYRGPTPVSSVSAPIILPPEPIEKRRAPKARRRVPVFDGVGLTPPPKSRRQQPGRTIQ